MQFLKTLIWILIAGLGIAFSLNNWVPVTIGLWAGLVADANLPLLVLCAFLLGFLPMQLIHQAVRWRLRQRIAGLERALNDLRAVHAGPAAPVVPLDPDAALPLPSPASPPATGAAPVEPALDPDVPGDGLR